MTEPARRRFRLPKIRREVRWSITIFVLFFVFEYLLLPEFASARKSLHLLGHVNVAYLLLGVGLEVLALIALPGVDAESAQAVIEDGDLVIAGTRVLPPELRTANIHRLELPQGRYYRRLRLPAGRYSAVRRTVANGCLVISLQKAGMNRG